MQINLNIDTKQLQDDFQFSEKNIAFAVVNAINKTVLMVQKREQENARSKFRLRGGSGEQLVLRSVGKIQPFASVGKGRAYAEIFIDSSKPRMLLTDLELGGTKKSLFGSSVAVPITGSPARQSFASSVPTELYISKLNLKTQLTADQERQRRSIKGSNRKATAQARKAFVSSLGSVRLGEQRTYQIPGVGVFQRTGPKPRDSKLIYKFKPSPQLRPMLGFTQIATIDGQSWLNVNLEVELTNTVFRKFK